MKKNTLITLLILPFFIGCKKNTTVSLSSDKEIYSFILPFPSPTPWVSGVINNDTITVKVPVGVSLASITPVIQYYGKSITPAEGTAVNFTSPVTYTITAEDGSTRRQVVIVSYKSTTKDITDLRFRPAENPALASVVVGQLINDSSIVVRVPASTNVTALVPTITHNGVSISPNSGQAANFSDVVNYTVSAEDASTKKYNVFVTSNSMVYVGSANGFLYAVDALSGQLKWSFNGGGLQMDGPICYQGKVYVTVSGGGPVYCLNAETGAVIWSYPPASSGYGTPCVFNGTVYVGYSSSVGWDCGVHAINANTGTLIWSKLVASTFYSAIHTPTVVAGYVVVTEFVTGLHVLNAATGNLVWTTGLGINSANPLVKNGIIYIGGEFTFLRAYDLVTGAVVWQNNSFFGNVSGCPVMANDMIYVGTGNKMYAVNKTTGAIVWSQSPLSSGTYFSSVSVSLPDNALYAGSDDGRLYCLDLTTGAIKWAYINNENGGTYTPSPVAANGMVVVNGLYNSLNAVSAKSGKLIWKFTAPGLINTDPCVSDVAGNAYYTGRSGND